MGWNVLSLFRLFCAMAAMTAMAGVNSQGNSTNEDSEGDPILLQAFEGAAVTSMMQSWLQAGTSPGLFSDWDWYLGEHPCYMNDSRDDVHWYGIDCLPRFFQPENSSLVQYYTLVDLSLDLVDLDPMRLIGELPRAILNLTNLESLDITNATKLSGPLPKGLFCFSDVLRSIKLSNCSFNGSISAGFDSPDCDSNVYLEQLDLSGNSFAEMSPLSELVKNFYLLQNLNVSNNQIKGEFAISTNGKLQTIDVSYNFITNITACGDFQLLTTSGISSDLSNCCSLKSIQAQNNSISRFPIEIFDFESLQDINLDFNNISSITPTFSKSNASTIQKISMTGNKLQDFPEGLLQLPNLEEIILDSNNIGGELVLPNISCHYSSIKLISLLYNNITFFYPSNDTTSCFSESSILSNPKIFLYGNPICTNQSYKTKLLRFVCRINATSHVEEEEFSIVQKSNKILVIIVACASGVLVLFFIIGFFVIQKLRRKISRLRDIQSEFDKRDVKPNLYSFSELKAATQDFHIRNELGRGGFGIVYKGVLLDGSHVAVKKLTKLSMEQGIQDFLSEIIVVSNIKHRNLVRLKGCCIKENQRILVHEFVENKNLADALWGISRSDVHLDWPTRFNIILGIARGLTYLHEDVQPAIVHRDIKGENILLDKYCNPKIADFGLALFFPSFDDGETHMSVSKVAGTRGYMAPEYVCYGQVSTKLDVFSFGVLLLEIVSGRKKIDLKSPLEEQYLVQWAQECHSNDNLLKLKDKSLQDMTMVEEVTFKQLVKVGLQCMHHIAARRPTMSEVVAMLIGNKNVNDCALEDYQRSSTPSTDIESSSYSLTTTSLSQYIVKDDDILRGDSDSYKQALQLSEIGLLKNSAPN